MLTALWKFEGNSFLGNQIEEEATCSQVEEGKFGPAIIRVEVIGWI